jgi:pimeloyl-ACP methyl ester carboxylesterase
MSISAKLGAKRSVMFSPVEHGRRLAELLPQGRFQLVQDSRTFSPEDQPGLAVQLVRELLASA